MSVRLLCRFLSFCLLSIFLSTAYAQQFTQSASHTPASVSIPVAFELNQGQAPATYHYVAHNTGGEVRFTDSGPDILINGKTGRAIIHLRSVGMSAETRVEGKLPLQAKTNYLIGSDASRWIRNVSTYAEVAYDGIYPGVDLLFYGSKDHLEHDFIVSPHADPSGIRFTLTGAEQLELNDSGDLVASAAGEKIILQKPAAYQEIDGKKIEVKSAFRLDDSQSESSPVVSFQLGNYDPERQLIIDPVFSFSTYLAGTGMDQVTAVTTDAAGNIYLTGTTSSSDFPTQNAEQTQLGCSPSGPSECQNVFITKLGPTGHTLLYSTYLGGSSQDYGAAIAVDASGNVVVAGVSMSSDFPHAGAVSSLSCQINDNCYFLASLKPDGSELNYSGQIGGSEGLYTNANSSGRLAVDVHGNAYLAGTTDSSNFQITSGTLTTTVSGYPNSSTFVLKVDPAGKVLYSTTIPGNAAPNPSQVFNNFFLPTGIAVDSSGQVTVAGTGGVGLPTTTGVVATAFPNNATNVESPTAGYILQLNATASAINYGTYVPGTDSLGGMAVDGSGNVYLAGSTSETTLPVSTNAYQKSIIPAQTGQYNSGFIVKLNSQGTSILAASYLSGSPINGGSSFTGIALDSHSNVYVGGETGSVDFPLQNPFVTQWEYSSSAVDMVVAELSSDLSSLAFGSFLNSTDGIYPGSIFSALTIDPNDNFVVAGTTYANDFPTTAGSFEPQPPPPARPNSGTVHSFVSKINMTTPAPSFCPSAWSVAFGLVPAQISSTQTLNVTNCGNAPLDFGTMTSSVPSITATQSCGSVAPGAVCAVTLTFTPTSSNAVSGTVSFADNAVISPQIIQVSGQGEAPDLEPASNPLSFGNLLVGTQGPAVILSVYNRGNAPLTISNLSISGGGFSIATDRCTGTWLANSICSVSLTFSPPTSGVLNGSLTITSNDPVHPQLTVSLMGTGYSVYAVPVISSIGNTSATTQQTVQINNGPVTLQVFGSNFYPASVVQVNGVTQQTTFENNGLLQVTVAASSLTTIGELPLTVVNPSPGGGTSAAVTLTPYNALTLTPSFLVSVPSTGMLYASIPNSTIINPNTVVPIEAATGTVGTPIPVGRNPVMLAASSDGKYLYVALAGDQAIQRINLQTQVIERTFPFPANICTTCGPASPVDLQVVPGNSQEVVLSQGNMLTLYNDAGVVNYVPGTFSLYYMAPFNSIAFAGTPQSIYSLPFTDVQNSFFGMVTLDEAGLQYTPVTDTNYGGNNTTGGQVVSDGTLLYTNSGEVWNPATAAQTGTFPVTTFNSTSYPNERNLTIDASLGELYVIGEQNYGNGSDANVLTAYGQQLLAITGTLAFPQINTAILTNLVRWGSNGFAFLDSGNVYIVRSSIASPQAVNPLPTLMSISPLSANAGGRAFTLTLNGTNFLPNSTVAWSGTLLPVTYLSRTQLTVPVPASAIAASGTAEITVSNPSPGGGTSAAIAFATTVLTTPTVAITSSANPVLLQNPVTLTVSAGSAATGTVTFMDGTAVLGSAALSNGIAAYTSSSLAVGSHIITASYSGDANFLPTTASLTEVVQDFTLAVASSSSSSQTVQRGGAVTYSLLLNPSGIALPAAMTLAVSGLPPGATAVFSPSTIAAGAGATPVTLTVQIPTDLAEHRRERTLGGVGSLTFALLIMPFLRGRKPRLASLALILCSGLVGFLLMGCAGSNGSSSNSSTPAAQTYMLTVTGTIGADAHSTTLTLIVQ
jgi:hypothetical protein